MLKQTVVPPLNNSDAIANLLDRMKGTLRFLADSGVSGLHCRPETVEIVKSWQRPLPPPDLEVPGAVASPPPDDDKQPAQTAADRKSRGAGGADLDAVRRDLGDCARCPLSQTRTTIVFGEGNPRARLLFVGEGPGRDEDIQGRPFVGAAGQLLTKIIQAMGLTRRDVYIANIIKCRPPQNRNPRPEEIEACCPFLQRQIDAIAPEVICALGKFAAQTLLQTNQPITRLRGRFYEYKGIPLMPTFHPAFLLRNAERKRDTWNDIQQVMERLGLQRPS